MVTSSEILERMAAPEFSEAECLAKLRAFRKIADEQSEERWSGRILKLFMEHICGYPIEYRTFTRWKTLAGIASTRHFYGHGSFVLATAIGQLKREGQKIVLTSQVMARLKVIDQSLGIKVWNLQTPQVESNSDLTPAIELPDKIEQMVGIRRSEDFYARNLDNYSRKNRYTLSEVIKIASAVQRWVEQRGTKTNGKKSSKTNPRRAAQKTGSRSPAKK